MIRTRLLWFSSGFLLTGTSIAYFLHRDLSTDRHLLLAQLKDNFGALESRVSSLESHSSNFQQSSAQSFSQDGGSSS